MAENPSTATPSTRPPLSWKDELAQARDTLLNDFARGSYTIRSALSMDKSLWAPLSRSVIDPRSSSFTRDEDGDGNGVGDGNQDAANSKHSIVTVITHWNDAQFGSADSESGLTYAPPMLDPSLRKPSIVRWG
ncbi:uncharacterized protein I303_100885 [Kwoniella dejecticola CBS 10117]|uniref:Uncharacterized protein n=1 Tax=Kwoniella dejecticola CBS 10117 TaxID=1296121 RepID=A0A1A6AG66_9TREE|nr:uncharacterized protein I303_00889 [Kwoniella dejecticola CBS 10117]OBR89067.1 hypothetical protein I303_00889 [Kwoniella dejecticola CBS 10117]